MNNLLSVSNGEHTSLFVLPCRFLSSPSRGASITDLGLFSEAQEAIKEGLGPQGPTVPKHTTQTGKLLSSPARQRHLFVLCAVTAAQRWEHALDDRRALLKRGADGWQGVWKQCNLKRNSTSSLCELHNSSSEEERDDEALYSCWSVAALQQATGSLVTCFPWNLNVDVIRPSVNSSAVALFFPLETTGLQGERQS